MSLSRLFKELSNGNLSPGLAITSGSISEKTIQHYVLLTMLQIIHTNRQLHHWFLKSIFSKILLSKYHFCVNGSHPREYFNIIDKAATIYHNLHNTLHQKEVENTVRHLMAMLSNDNAYDAHAWTGVSPLKFRYEGPPTYKKHERTEEEINQENKLWEENQASFLIQALQDPEKAFVKLYKEVEKEIFIENKEEDPGILSAEYRKEKTSSHWSKRKGKRIYHPLKKDPPETKKEKTISKKDRLRKYLQEAKKNSEW